MPNSFKYSLSTETLSLRKDDFYLGIGDVGKAVTGTSGFWNGLNPQVGGYVIYLNKASGGPSIYVATGDAQLVNFTNRIAGTSYSTVNECLDYFMGQSDKICTNFEYESITTNGLVLNLDAGFVASYPKNGVTWFDLSTGNNNSTLSNGPGFDTDKYGSLIFDGTDDYVDFYASGLDTVATVEMWVYLGAGYSDKMFMGWAAYDIYCAGGTIGFNTGNGDVYGISSAQVSDLRIVNNWAHYVFVFQKNISYTNNKIYINGVSQTLSQQYGTEYGPNRDFNGGQGRIAGWRNDSGYRIPMNCAVFRVYNRELGAAEVLNNYNQNKGRFQNYFPNGNFLYGNWNYSAGTANSEVTLPGYSYSLQMPQVQYASFFSDNLFQVDTSKSYRMVVQNRTLTKGGPDNDILSGGHVGFACYDSSFRFIDLRMCGDIANTYLTRNLNAGDTYVYVSNQNNEWASAGSEYYFRHFCLYPPSHPEFSDAWKYTRIGYGDFDIYYDEIVDIGGGELRLRFGYNGSTFPNIGYPTPAGTPVMNGRAGGTYNYVFYPAEGAFGSWSTHNSSIFTGESRSSSVPFRYGTKYINFLHLINYAVPGGTSPLPVMLFGDITLNQIKV
jgi:hypothetical protein